MPSPPNRDPGFSINILLRGSSRDNQVSDAGAGARQQPTTNPYARPLNEAGEFCEEVIRFSSYVRYSSPCSLLAPDDQTGGPAHGHSQRPHVLHRPSESASSCSPRMQLRHERKFGRITIR
jgi:hypothetical protein